MCVCASVGRNGALARRRGGRRNGALAKRGSGDGARGGRNKAQKRCRETQNLISSVVNDVLVHVCLAESVWFGRLWGEDGGARYQATRAIIVIEQLRPAAGGGAGRSRRENQRGGWGEEWGKEKQSHKDW